MEPSAPATVVWVAPETDGARAALERWARARGVALRPPGDAERPRVAVDPAAADAVEQELARARDAMGSLDAAAVERALEAADAALRAHPELPQAAWLRAEVERAWSSRFARVEPRDPDRAARAWARAAALDGGRVAGVGEAATRGTAEAAALTVANLPAGATARVDGELVDRSHVARRAPGEHALVVAVDGAPSWASWVTLPAEGTTIDLPNLDAPACSRSDVSRAAASLTGALDASRVTCPAWIAVREARPGAVAIARCEASRCAGWVEWRPGGDRQGGGPRPAEARPWPAWATWTIVGAGAAIAAGAIVVAAGAFDRAPRETRFVNGGLKASSAGPAGFAF